MSTHSIEDSTVPTREPSAEVKGSAVRGAWVGLGPLGLLAGFVALAVVLTALARLLAAGAGFFAQQQAVLGTLVAGLVLAIVIFAIGIWRVLRRVAAWQRDGAVVQANSALWALGATALVIVIPILLGLLLPQHPFP